MMEMLVTKIRIQYFKLFMDKFQLTVTGLGGWDTCCWITGVDDLIFFEENVCWRRATNFVNDEEWRLRECCDRCIVDSNENDYENVFDNVSLTILKGQFWLKKLILLLLFN